MSATTERPIGVFYEHPDWFRPLFAELDSRGTPYVKQLADTYRFDPAEEPRCSLVFNRMSPSAWLRGRGNEIFYTLEYLAYLKAHGIRVVNGYEAFVTETSKSHQLGILGRLGLPFPKANVIHSAGEVRGAAAGLRLPVVVKPNIGGSGAGIRRFDRLETLERAAASGELELGIDRTALVQEFIPTEDGSIVRVEVLGGRYLYAIRVFSSGESFNLCPADICQTTDGAELNRAACPVDAPKNGLRVESCTPPSQQIAEVERIMEAAGIEVGGIEYLVDSRDGQLYYYDINALSNFVADAPRVIGFDPFVRLTDYLEREAT